MYHNPVLLTECLEGLAIRPDGVYVDVTFGGGGHSREILKRLVNGQLISFDQDEDAAGQALQDPRFTFVAHNFRYLVHFLRYYKVLPVDGILADLGISSHQIDTPERGFSTRSEGEIDMRMNRKSGLTAKYIINEYALKDLIRIFRLYGEIENAGKLATQIVETRKAGKINTNPELKEAMTGCVPRFSENQYYARVFQALRIEVNKEMDALQELLKQIPVALKPGGRLVVMSYHSLEDRMVKNFMKSGNVEGHQEKDFYGNMNSGFKQITRKPLMPDESEINNNPRSRSAKLRIAEKL